MSFEGIVGDLGFDVTMVASTDIVVSHKEYRIGEIDIDGDRVFV